MCMNCVSQALPYVALGLGGMRLVGRSMGQSLASATRNPGVSTSDEGRPVAGNDKDGPVELDATGQG